MSGKHTPGPWIHEVGPDAPIGSVETIDGHPIAQSQPNSTIPGDDPIGMIRMRNANARLIAAAPDLLEALEAVMEGSEFGEITQMPGTYCWKSRATPSHGSLDNARAAIAKARGEA